MNLNKQIAQKIVKRAMQIIKKSVNVMDENGIIIASGDVSRLNQKHTGAVLAIRENRVVEINQQLAEKWLFEVKPGINLPINYLGKTLGAVGISGDPEEVSAYAELVKMAAELILEQHFLLEQERWSHRYKEEFILQLLTEKPRADDIEQQAGCLGIDFTVSYVVVMIQITESNTERLQELVEYLEHHHANHHFAIRSLSQLVLLVPQHHLDDNQAQAYLRKLLPPNTLTHHYKIAVGANVAHYSKLFLSYKTALTTLQYGLRFFPKKSVYFFDEYQLPVLLHNLSGSWQAEELLKPVYQLSAQDKHKVLDKTLKQYFLSNCDLTLTAEKLHIHINTLRYRLNRIEQISSLSFNKIDDLFRLYLSTIL